MRPTTCRVCSSALPVKKKGERGRYRVYCSDPCRWYSETKAFAAGVPFALEVPEGFKRCGGTRGRAGCGKVKHRDEFHRNATSSDGLTNYCRECAASRQRDATDAARVTGAARERHLRQKYGLTTDDYDEMLRAQGGACAVCGGGPRRATGVFVIDHDHVTRTVRGLLCNHCNTALGLFEDNVERLASAIAYLGRAA